MLDYKGCWITRDVELLGCWIIGMLEYGSHSVIEPLERIFSFTVQMYVI